MNQAALNQFVQIFTLEDQAAAQRVSERLALVLSNPENYLGAYEEELAERGILSALPPQELRDIALIDALLMEDLAWESDWVDTAPAIAEGLNDILARQNRTQTLLPNTLIGRREPGPEQLDTVQDALEKIGLALVLFTLDSDSYPLGIVAEADVEQVRSLAKELGFELVVY
ncbi:hypothetical protein I2I05_05610 [Hymenobacter sp. BT683]|uniref:DUF6630 domain-containing protein n=1 Tax=Hymenobacter jeongseonensis TaxID=2791027 RepID=A0ABS0IET2_9BACT|nr:hypothetical protein [Hymenobacter jeongseonensis]MBF9236866.1 hypothetical protein [Hymenobacter jeongseonensis]